MVGGGPAGMEAARVAAERGHEVVLYEKESRLGGLLPVAAIVKDLETEELTDLVRYLSGQLRKEGVTVHLDKAVTPEVVRAEKPDVLVLAAGAAHTEFDLPGAAGGATSRKVVKTEKLHGRLKLAAQVLLAGPAGELTRLWMPVRQERGHHGRHAARLRAGRVPGQAGPPGGHAHNGRRRNWATGMSRDDLENLWPWFKLKHVPIWPTSSIARSSSGA